MDNETYNDNERSAALADMPAPDAHGQAAMLLVESLIHGLIERSVISLEEAIEIVDVAAEVNIQAAGDGGDSPVNGQKSLSLLTAISSSLSLDI